MNTICIVPDNLEFHYEVRIEDNFLHSSSMIHSHQDNFDEEKKKGIYLNQKYILPLPGKHIKLHTDNCVYMYMV